MIDTKTLEENIREKAVREFRKTLEEVGNKFFTTLGFTTYTEFNLGVKPNQSKEFKRLTPHHLIKEIIDQTVEKRRTEIGDKAVQAFIKKVEILQEEVDSIKDVINL